jgi:tRNA nucleotidyltransferase (CCA-adding enzyme)
VADIPVPGEELTPDAGQPVDPAPALPAAVQHLLDRLWSAGHAAYVVGGSLRDSMLGRTPADWDLATSALPGLTAALFPEAAYENAFGSVVVPSGDATVGDVDITTMRSDHDYADFRRPHRVDFTDSIELDLARRDFTVNAIAWGAEAGGTARLVDPHGGREDLARRILRAVGDPSIRFGEDALRMLRAVRLAATLGFEIEPATLAAISERAELVRHLSGERVATELRLLLASDTPSTGLRLLADTGVLAHLAPELAAQRGVPQNKVPGEDLWDHTVRSVDGATTDPPHLRLAAMLHDLGKPSTMADGRFVGHERVGADMARTLLDRWHWPVAERERVAHLIRHHMFGYVPRWSDAAVRRFIVKVGPDALGELFLLREADNRGSGLPSEAGRLAELRSRVAAQLDSGAALDLRSLAVDGTDLMTEFGWRPGPIVGKTLQRLLDRVIGDPTLNTRERLLSLARSMAPAEPGS